LLTVPLDVERGHVKKVGIVTEEAQALVASLAEQLSDLAGRVVVIQMLGRWVATDPAPVPLGLSQVIHCASGQLVLPVEVGIPAGGALAGLAPAGQARCCATAPVEVLARDGLLTRWAPSEAFGDPRMVADGLAHGLTALTVVRVALGPVARQTVEGQAIPQGAVLTELRRRLCLVASWAALHR
jgi:hypothetical protein